LLFQRAIVIPGKEQDEGALGRSSRTRTLPGGTRAVEIRARSAGQGTSPAATSLGSDVVLSELVRGDDRPCRIDLGLHRVVLVAPFPELGLPDPKPALRRTVRLERWSLVIVPGALDFRHDDLVGIVGHVKHLVGVVSDRPMLLLALSARGATLVIPGDFLAMLSRPFGHLDHSSCPGRVAGRSSWTKGGPRLLPMCGS